MKKLANLNGVKTLNKKDQKGIFGGIGSECRTAKDCYIANGGSGNINDYLCIDGHCAFNPFNI